MTYKEAMAILDELPKFSFVGGEAYKPGLETALELAEIFGNPHNAFKSIHIAGTNGKGSTAHMLASILQEAGYKVGLYTSPHLIDFRERMKINGKMIPEEKVVEFISSWSNSGVELSPSFFELTMIMAFDWFAKEKVDYAIIEVGMGGRLDSTNIISPELSVITNISNDHNQFLGDTPAEIAFEKAGIIKRKTPVIIGETQKETEKVFRDKAFEMDSEINFADRLAHPESKSSAEGRIFEINGEEVIVPLSGEYQKKNIVTVLCCVDKLKELGASINNSAIRRGFENVLKNTGFSGRWTLLSNSPLVITDIGHNTAGLKYNFEQLKELIDNKPGASLKIIIGFMADKAIDEIIELLPRKARYYATNAPIPRALPANILTEKLIEKGLECQTFDNLMEAYQEALKEASESDIIFIGGSNAIVGSFLRSFSPCAEHDSCSGCY